MRRYEDIIRPRYASPLRRSLLGHTVDTAYERGWSTLANSDLLKAAERDGYDLLITTDRNLRYQQNLTSRKIAIVVLLSTSWPRIQQHIGEIQNIISTLAPGAYHEIEIAR
ncbi:hypothetical protein [Lusitaniella coriacea]|uniref:hypothetical protein n=1 Tax=Lusitaniella coriacea TaxID=1983105 RepID=UPI003CEEC78B